MRHDQAEGSAGADAIVLTGETAAMSGEAASRASGPSPPSARTGAVADVAPASPSAVVFFNGRPLVDGVAR